jgi:hypothetical protein
MNFKAARGRRRAHSLRLTDRDLPVWSVILMTCLVFDAASHAVFRAFTRPDGARLSLVSAEIGGL